MPGNDPKGLWNPFGSRSFGPALHPEQGTHAVQGLGSGQEAEEHWSPAGKQDTGLAAPGRAQEPAAVRRGGLMGDFVRKNGQTIR